MSVFSNPSGGAAAAAERYTRALLDRLGGRDPVAVMAEQAEALQTLVAGTDDATVRTPEAPGKWSMIEVIVHLADTEIVYGWRYRMPLAEHRPSLTGFDQEAWARAFRYREQPLAPTLERLRVTREANLDLLRSLTPEQWAREAIHAERGPESVRRIAELGAAHDLVHRAQLERIRSTVHS